MATSTVEDFPKALLLAEPESGSARTALGLRAARRITVTRN
jgi:hypothetical protein